MEQLCFINNRIINKRRQGSPWQFPQGCHMHILNILILVGIIKCMFLLQLGIPQTRNIDHCKPKPNNNGNSHLPTLTIGSMAWLPTKLETSTTIDNIWCHILNKTLIKNNPSSLKCLSNQHQNQIIDRFN